MRIKVLTYNIHKGFSLFGSLVLPKIRSAIAEVGADLVFLQEVSGEHRAHSEVHNEWPEDGVLEFLADQLWPHHAYGKNAIHDHGHHGNAVMSRLPFSSIDNIDVSNSRFEKRGLLHVVIDPGEGSKPVHAICVHLDLTERGRRKQVDRLAERIAAEVPSDCPLIVAGDFNDWRELSGARIEEILQVEDAHKFLHGEHARTFPSRFPILRLDRIYVRGLTPVRARALSGPPWSELSDHNALYAELET